MQEITFFQKRPADTVGSELHQSFALNSVYAEALLEKNYDEYEILKADTFSNGVLVTAEVSSEPWYLAMCPEVDYVECTEEDGTYKRIKGSKTKIKFPDGTEKVEYR